MAAAIAKAYTSDAYCAITQRSIQIFGAIGFTWEMANHLYFKRARANAELFGNSRTQRGRLMDMVTKRLPHAALASRNGVAANGAQTP